MVGLLCVRKARSGGVSRIVSAAQIHNEILRRRPDLIDLFYADWYHSRQGDEAPGEQRAYAKPIFGFRDGYFSGIFSPNYVRAAQKYPEVPAMSSEQEEALALFNALTDELALDMTFEPGDIQLLNNHLIYHSRTDFEDYEEPDQALAVAVMALGAQLPAVARGLGVRVRDDGVRRGTGRCSGKGRLAGCSRIARPSPQRFIHEPANS